MEVELLVQRLLEIIKEIDPIKEDNGYLLVIQKKLAMERLFLLDFLKIVEK